ncbi:MAG: 3-methyl-2-oxobutanoate hydroxymethyltransferase, partial [Okeania sp. SIO2H7]|nr:3-methyl-2-oxobutanoate hydroxymethyltransferase [Okeania sp. SIO2H7]
AETVNKLTLAGIPVLAHVGLTPQSVHQFGGYRKQGKTDGDRDRILAEAIALEKAGAFAIVLEHIPADLGKTISEKLIVPTIGIGAGPHCDGQVLVINDMLGLSAWQPPFAKTYANLGETITKAVKDYCAEVREQKFP